MPKVVPALNTTPIRTGDGRCYSATIPSARLGHSIALTGNREERLFLQRISKMDFHGVPISVIRKGGYEPGCCNNFRFHLVRYGR